MTIFQSIVLGIVQGITEFLPVSSSGHLVLVPHLLGWTFPVEEAFVFDVLVQVATLTAVFAYFWKDLVMIVQAVIMGIICRQPFANPLARQGWFIVLATIPASVCGYLLKDYIALAFSSPLVTAFFLLMTAGLLVVAEKAGKRLRPVENLNWKDAVWIGAFQALSLLPGISRSGATMTGGMTRDLKRPAAARFSFLMSIPVMLGAGLVASLDLMKVPHLATLLPVFIPGFITAAIVGYISIRWLLGYLVRNRLNVFAIYCAALGLFVLTLAAIK